MGRRLLVLSFAAAILVPAVLWEPASRAPTIPAGPELPDRVANAHFSPRLPFGCPEAFPSHDWIQVAVDDRVSYDDLLRALVAADEAGVEVEVIEPALPVYPHHGWMG